jgi:hypothetical protein
MIGNIRGRKTEVRRQCHFQRLEKCSTFQHGDPSKTEPSTMGRGFSNTRKIPPRRAAERRSFSDDWKFGRAEVVERNAVTPRGGIAIRRNRMPSIPRPRQGSRIRRRRAAATSGEGLWRIRHSPQREWLFYEVGEFRLLAELNRRGAAEMVKNTLPRRGAVSGEDA